jgi:TM2 domain-containing membrane protein YozV
MGKILGAGVTGILTAILVGAIIWFVLQVIIGVIAWVSVVAGGVIAIIGILTAVGVFGARAASKHHAVGAH